MEGPAPQKEHRWLQQLVGDWTYEAECRMAPDQPPTKWGGQEQARCLGELWTIGEGSGEMPGGGECRSVMTLGFDPEKGRFVNGPGRRLGVAGGDRRSCAREPRLPVL